MVDVFQIVLEDFFWDLGLTDWDLLNWFAVGCLFDRCVADTSSEEVLSAVDDDRGVVYCIDLDANEGHAHGFGHAHCDIVDQESDLF